MASPASASISQWICRCPEPTSRGCWSGRHASEGYPQATRTDNGPEFTCRAFMAWLQARGIEHILIQPGKPTQNAYIESFNGRFRDECLNENRFET
ncbi:hypothetical protein CEK69_06295 [Xanthomonas sp. LMG 12462]|nr:hypothetical protein CEK69_06295 [Xanthomonas sp. LMG 12462]